MAEYERRFDTGGQASPRDVAGEAGEQMEDIASQLKETGQEYAEKAEDVASSAGDTAREYVESAGQEARGAREQTASGIQRAAQMVREKTGSAGGLPAQAGAKAADTLDGASDYLRSHRAGEIREDAEGYAKQHPGRVLIGAILAGFLLGKVLP